MFNILSARQQPKTNKSYSPTARNRIINYKILTKEAIIIHKMNKHHARQKTVIKSLTATNPT